MIDKFNFHSHESTCIHILKIHLLFLRMLMVQLCKCYHGNHLRP